MPDIRIGFPYVDYQVSYSAYSLYDTKRFSISYNSKEFWISVRSYGTGIDGYRIYRDSPEGRELTRHFKDIETDAQFDLFLYGLFFKHTPIEDLISWIDSIEAFAFKDGQRDRAAAIASLLNL